MNIFIGKDGKQLGPFTEEQLRSMFESGMLSATDVAWQEGWPDWTPLWQLFGTPPPLATAPVSAISESSQAMESPTSTSEEPSTWIYGGWAALALSLLPGTGGYIALFYLVIAVIVLFCSNDARSHWHAKAILFCAGVIFALSLMIGFIIGGILS